MTRHMFSAVSINVAVVTLFAAAAATAQPARATAFKALADFERCLQDHYAQEICLRSLDDFIGKHPEKAMDAGRQVRRNFNSYVSLPYFETAQKRQKGGFCADADVQLAVVSGLSLPADYANAERARKLFAGACFAEHEAAVLAELKNKTGASYLKDNACPILKGRGRAPTACEPAAKTPEAAVEERLPGVNKADLRLGIVKSYLGPEGERVTLAPIEGGDLYLVRFEGVAGPWNGKSILHKRAERGNGMADFWTEHEGKRWVGIVQRSGMEVFAPGNRKDGGFHIRFSETASRSIDAKAVLDAF